MIRCDTVFGNGGTVVGSWVAFVFGPVVLRKFFINLQHKIVAEGFGQHRGRRYRQLFAIAFHNCLILNVIVRFEAVAIDNDELGTYRKLVECQMHRFD